MYPESNKTRHANNVHIPLSREKESGNKILSGKVYDRIPPPLPIALQSFIHTQRNIFGGVPPIVAGPQLFSIALRGDRPVSPLLLLFALFPIDFNASSVNQFPSTGPRAHRDNDIPFRISIFSRVS